MREETSITHDMTLCRLRSTSTAKSRTLSKTANGCRRCADNTRRTLRACCQGSQYQSAPASIDDIGAKGNKRTRILTPTHAKAWIFALEIRANGQLANVKAPAQAQRVQLSKCCDNMHVRDRE